MNNTTNYQATGTLIEKNEYFCYDTLRACNRYLNKVRLFVFTPKSSVKKKAIQ